MNFIQNIFILLYLPKVFVSSALENFYFYQSIFAQLTLFDFGLGLAAHIYISNNTEIRKYAIEIFRLIQIIFMLIALVIFILVINFGNLQFFTYLIFVILNSTLAIVFRVDNLNGDIAKYYRYSYFSSIISIMVVFYLYSNYCSNVNSYLLALVMPQFFLFLLNNVLMGTGIFCKLDLLNLIHWRKIFSTSLGLIIMTCSSLMLNLYDGYILKSSNDFLTYSHLIRLVNILILPLTILFTVKQNDFVNKSVAISGFKVDLFWNKLLYYMILYCAVIVLMLLYPSVAFFLSKNGFIGFNSNVYVIQFVFYLFFIAALVFYSAKDSSMYQVSINARFYLSAVLLSIIAKVILFYFYPINLSAVLMINITLFTLIYFLPSQFLTKYYYEKN